jgi:SulP family sulfate permease
LFGGITAAVIALTMAFTYGVASDACAEADFYGVIIIGLFAAMFSDSSALTNESTGTVPALL